MTSWVTNKFDFVYKRTGLGLHRLFYIPHIHTHTHLFYNFQEMAYYYAKAHMQQVKNTAASANNHIRRQSPSASPSMGAHRTAMTRENLLAMARNEYARQLCKFTEAQLKQRVPSCYTNSSLRAHMPPSLLVSDKPCSPSSTVS